MAWNAQSNRSNWYFDVVFVVIAATAERAFKMENE